LVRTSRSLALFLFLTTPAITQAPKIPPPTGHVYNASNGKPLAGATVHYRGEANAFDEHNHVVNPPTVQGEVRTAADGSYTLPDLPGGAYGIRASAPGFFSDQLQADPRMAGERTPFGYVMKLDLRLQPNHGLIAMKMSGLPAREGHYPDGSIDIAVLSPDGDSILFPLFRNEKPAELWLYRISSEQFQQIVLPPAVAKMAITQLAWDGKTGIFLGNIIQSPADSSHYIGSFKLPSLQATIIPTTSDPVPNLTIIRGDPDYVRFVPRQQPIDCDSGSDGTGTGCHNSATDLIVHDNETHRDIVVARRTDTSYVLDPSTSTLFYYDAGAVKTPHQLSSRDPMVQITALSFLTGKRTISALPGGVEVGGISILDVRGIRDERHLLTGFRVAYRRPGDCDPASVDQAPRYDTGIDPHLWDQPADWSVCFLTIPPTVATRTPKPTASTDAKKPVHH
jgi:hypothetical protein